MWSIEKRYVRKDGKLIWVAVNGAMMRLNGRPHRTVANVVDITERKSYEETLRRTGRL